MWKEKVGLEDKCFGPTAAMFRKRQKMCILTCFCVMLYNYCPVVLHFIRMKDTKKIEKVEYQQLILYSMILNLHAVS